MASYDGFVFNVKKEWKTLDENVQEEVRDLVPGIGPMMGRILKL